MIVGREVMSPESQEKLPGFLSNTISYGRLGVLLVVHAALMIATNAALNLGVAGIALAIICNILIILMEETLLQKKIGIKHWNFGKIYQVMMVRYMTMNKF